MLASLIVTAWWSFLLTSWRDSGMRVVGRIEEEKKKVRGGEGETKSCGAEEFQESRQVEEEGN